MKDHLEDTIRRIESRDMVGLRDPLADFSLSSDQIFSNANLYDLITFRTKLEEIFGCKVVISGGRFGCSVVHFRVYAEMPNKGKFLEERLASQDFEKAAKIAGFNTVISSNTSDLNESCTISPIGAPLKSSNYSTAKNRVPVSDIIPNKLSKTFMKEILRKKRQMLYWRTH